MALKTQWMDQYFLSVRKNVNIYDTADTTHTNAGAWSTDGAKHFTTNTEAYGYQGPGSNPSKRFQYALNNHPDFVPGQEIITTRKTIGSPVATGGDGYEITRGGIAPTATWEMDVDQHGIVPILWSLFHQGASEAVYNTSEASNIHFEPKRLTSASVDPAAAEAYVTLMRRMSYDANNSIALSDAVCSGLTFSAAEGEPLRASAEFVGRFLDTNVDFDGDFTVVEGFGEHQPLMWNDAVITLEDLDGSGVHYIIPASAFSLTITPTISIKRYDSRWPMRYVISNWSISGSISIPWTLVGDGTSNTAIGENYLLNRLVRDDSATQNNITPMEMTVNWFNSGITGLDVGDSISNALIDTIRDYTDTATISGGDHGAGDVTFAMGVSPTNIETGGEDETMITMTFECVDIRSGNTVTQEALNIDLMSAYNYGIDDNSPPLTMISDHAGA